MRNWHEEDAEKRQALIVFENFLLQMDILKRLIEKNGHLSMAKLYRGGSQGFSCDTHLSSQR